MADEPEGSLPSQDPGGEPAAASEPPKMTTEGARAETAAPKTSSPQTAATPAATADTFKTPPSGEPGKPVDEVPAVAGGTNAPVVAQPAPKPAPAAAAAAAVATGTAAAATGTAKAPAPAARPAAKPAAPADGVTRRGLLLLGRRGLGGLHGGDRRLRHGHGPLHVPQRPLRAAHELQGRAIPRTSGRAWWTPASWTSTASGSSTTRGGSTR